MSNTYEDPRAHAVRKRYLDIFGGEEIPVPVEQIAEDLFGLHVETSTTIGYSGMLLPAARRIVLKANEATYGDAPVRRHRFTIAHELGHWVCHALEGQASTLDPSYCRAEDVAHNPNAELEREANIFAAELLMPEPAVREAWIGLVTQGSVDEAVTACASRFDVSPTSMHWRLYSFALLPPPAKEL